MNQETIHVRAQLPSVEASLRAGLLAFVGEAPGDEELLEGEPFVGPSGRVFNALLRTAGLTREDHYVGNVFDEKLPDNNVGAWCASKREADAGGFADLEAIGAHGYLRPEHRGHLARLSAELHVLHPTVVIPLGGTALWAFTGRAEIGAYRGNVVAATQILPGAKLIPTYHPAFLLHSWKFYTTVVLDIQRAWREAQRGPEIVLPIKRLRLAPTLDEVRAYCVRMLCEPGPLSVDIETANGQITAIAIGPSAEEAMSIPFWNFEAADRSYWRSADDEAAAWDAVRAVLESPVPKLGQNYAGYDALYILERKGIRTMGLIHDTRLQHHALYPELPKSLEFMGSNYTQQGAWKQMGARRSKKDD